MKECHSNSTDRSVPEQIRKRHWRALEELASSPQFQEMLEREFPRHASEWNDPFTRRKFLMLMGASFALAGMSGCSPQAPIGEILPYAKQPEQMVPGRALQFASAATLGGYATGILVKSHEGRPTKIEGNPNHPASLGATDAFTQAEILGLYDPDRSQAITYRGQPRSWSDAQIEFRKSLDALRTEQGRGLVILSSTITSPTLADQLTGQTSRFKHDFPAARWFQFEPAHSNNGHEGARLALGEPLDTLYDFTSADVIISLDADFLGVGPAHLRSARDFSTKRRSAAAPGGPAMNRLYVAESAPSVTGSAADHRFPIRAADVEQFALSLASELQLPGLSRANAKYERLVAAIAKDLNAHRGASVVIAGETQPPIVHAIAHALNDTLGNVGHTVRYIAPVEVNPRDQIADLKTLTEDMSAGHVQMLIILGGNPVYDAPADLEFAKQLQHVPQRVHLGLYQDETSALCDWHLPQAHFLEAWGDARAFDGTVSIQQPLIAPLYNGVSAI
ncbi:MAG TPA: TAT-variant-translocated molybdopterin oxidoreductase, partial [Lacipirellulaceae bacterium]|nr:TAT-variant-translocated molybdopterin oxidoreductase [Lacipirellulaceae bacterium]